MLRRAALRLAAQARQARPCSASAEPELLAEAELLRMRNDLAHIQRFTLPASLSRAPLLVPFCHIGGTPSLLLLLRGGVDGLVAPETRRVVLATQASWRRVKLTRALRPAASPAASPCPQAPPPLSPLSHRRAKSC